MLERCEHCGRVYSDHDRPPEPAADRCPVCHGPLATPLTVEERFAILERSVARLRRRPDPPAAEGAGWWLLTFGQVVSVLVCTAVIVGSAWYLLYLQPRVREQYEVSIREQIALQPRVPEQIPAFRDQTLEVLVSAAATFAYSAAMFVVFTRVKRLPPS